MQAVQPRVRPLIAVFGVITTLTLGACDGGSDTDTGDQGLEIVGEYVDNFMSAHVITETEWTFDGSIYAIVEYDNDAGYLLAQNDEANTYNPGLFSRFDWTWSGDQLYYCQTAYDAASLELARMSGGADPDDLDMGCGMFPWSNLTAP
jgi:hypothetical protein